MRYKGSFVNMIQDDDGDNNDIEPLIFDLEEIECSLSDMDERTKT